jgi:hypothetical protein
VRRVTNPPNRAWLFHHPDLDAEAPGLSTAHTGRIALAREHESIRQSLFILLTTSPGERVMRPSWGCNLSRLAFAPNDDTTAGLGMHHVRKAVELWERRVEILSLDARRADTNPSALLIELKYRIRQSGREEQLAWLFSLEGVDR